MMKNFTSAPILFLAAVSLPFVIGLRESGQNERIRVSSSNNKNGNKLIQANSERKLTSKDDFSDEDIYDFYSMSHGYSYYPDKSSSKDDDDVLEDDNNTFYSMSYIYSQPATEATTEVPTDQMITNAPSVTKHVVETNPDNSSTGTEKVKVPLSVAPSVSSTESEDFIFSTQKAAIRSENIDPEKTDEKSTGKSIVKGLAAASATGLLFAVGATLAIFRRKSLSQGDAFAEDFTDEDVI